jgi:hypothetical protein
MEIVNTSLIPKETLLTHLQRAEMAETVTLPIEFFRDLIYQAMPQSGVRITKTAVGNHLRRHMMGDQPTFRQGFKEGVAFAETKLKEKNANPTN